MPVHDVVIRGGLVVDGLGGPASHADLAIDGGTISAVGGTVGRGRREVDADGRLVVPGFVDLHTHLDGQVAWDPDLTPCSRHGITSVLLGNCGMSFAPVRPDGPAFLAEVMEAVEDIPRDILLGELPWDWEAYDGYLAWVERRRPALNVAGLVGHCAVRAYVMGERAFEGPATAPEIAAMAEVVGASLAGGAFGFSTSRYLRHVAPDGRPVPGTHAGRDELVAIAAAMGAQGGGLFQNVLDYGVPWPELLDLLRAEAAACGRALFSVGVADDAEAGAHMAADLARLAGSADVTAMCMPRPSGALSGLDGMLPYRHGAWRELDDADFPTRVSMVADPTMRARLEHDARVGDPSIPLHWYRPLGAGPVPDYLGQPDLVTMASAHDEHPGATWLRVAAETGGAAWWSVELFNRSVPGLFELLTCDRVLPGLGDAGAHVGQVMDAGWTTFLLSYWVRDAGHLPLEPTVARMTSQPAAILGLDRRGRIAPGCAADVNVIDLDELSLRMPRMVRDLPGGAKRFVQHASGFVATLVNGTVILEDDELTGARPGHTLRRGRAA
jgi:N-acyl-D-aspartate/D-glutamate deacylase